MTTSPNYQHIHEGFQGLYYDPDNQYSVPYTYGVVGIIYDANQVDPADAQGWDLMWNEKYAGKILQFNNSGRLWHGHVQGRPGREHHRQGPVGPGPPDPGWTSGPW